MGKSTDSEHSLEVSSQYFKTGPAKHSNLPQPGALEMFGADGDCVPKHLEGTRLGRLNIGSIRVTKQFQKLVHLFTYIYLWEYL